MGVNCFQGRGYPEGPVISLPPREAMEFLSQDAILVDLREEYEINYRIFDVPRVLYVPMTAFEEQYAVIPKDRPVILADNVGVTTKKLAAFLLEKGYVHVASLLGGVLGWAEDRMPIKIDRGFELVGQCVCKLRPRNSRKETPR